LDSLYSIWHSIIIGIVEGLTEFLPVSSTGHMILTQNLLGLPEKDKVLTTFEIVIQLGAILAVVLVYWKRLMQLIGLMRSGSAERGRGGRKLNVLHILIGIVPVMGLAFVFKHIIEDKLFSSITVLIGLVLGGILMLVAEKRNSPVQANNLDEITYRQALYIGLWQIISLWPGFSRSGSTIAGGMLTGVSRAAAADFTFIMAIPIMVAASGYSLLKAFKDGIAFTPEITLFFVVGFVVSFIVALFAVITFIKLVQKLSLTYFAYYRFIVAAIFALYLLLTR
jgi:undecaprenyl-diphosphatase